MWANKVRADLITATVKIGLCGDGIVDTNEQCDGAALNGASCTTQGFTGGTLSCDPACDFDTSACTNTPVDDGDDDEGGGNTGGGGGGGTTAPPPATAVAFSGVTFSGREVAILRDAQQIATAIAGNDGRFFITVPGLSGGSYVFTLSSTDAHGLRSPLHSIPVEVVANTTKYITDVLIAPTVGVDKREVRQGSTVQIFGTSPPDAQIVLRFSNAEEQDTIETIEVSGSYQVTVNTAGLARGQHSIRAHYVLNGKTSPESHVVGFSVGDRDILVEAPVRSSMRGDINNDGFVNLVDFSIMAFWYKKSSPPASVDMNGDGVVDLADFSIMAFYWTG